MLVIGANEHSGGSETLGKTNKPLIRFAWIHTFEANM